MAKIALSVFKRDVTQTQGTVARAKSIANLLCEIHSVTFLDGVRKGIERYRIIWIIIRQVKLVIALITKKFDIVIACGDCYWGFPLMYLLAPFFRFKTMIDFHSIPSEEPLPRNTRLNKAVKRFWETFDSKHADYIIVVGENMLNYYKKLTHNCSLIPLHVDGSVFKNEPKKGFTPYKEQKVIGLIGPYVKSYPWSHMSLDFLYSRFDQFDERIKFIIIGDCDYQITNDRVSYTGYIDSIEEYISQICRLDAVFAFRGPATGPYTRAIEAMACGIPVILTPSALIGFGEVTPGRDILVFSEDNVVEGINKSIFNTVMMESLAENGRTTFERYYSKTAIQSRLLNIVEYLLRKPS